MALTQATTRRFGLCIVAGKTVGGGTLEHLAGSREYFVARCDFANLIFVTVLVVARVDTHLLAMLHPAVLLGSTFVVDSPIANPDADWIRRPFKILLGTIAALRQIAAANIVLTCPF